jgi:hypothetical protein
VNDYGQEFMDAWDRTVRFGLALPPIRLLVRKNCIDLAKALPVIVDYFNRHSGEALVGQTVAIHIMLLPPLCDALGGVPLQLTIGWIEFNGTPRMQHGEALIQRFLTEKWAAWHREGGPVPSVADVARPGSPRCDLRLKSRLGHLRRGLRTAGYLPAPPCAPGQPDLSPDPRRR